MPAPGSASGLAQCNISSHNVASSQLTDTIQFNDDRDWTRVNANELLLSPRSLVLISLLRPQNLPASDRQPPDLPSWLLPWPAGDTKELGDGSN